MVKIKKIGLFIGIILILSSCNISYNSGLIGELNPIYKTISIENGSDALLIAIKQIFTDNSWTITGYEKSETLPTYEDQSTRYLFVADYALVYDGIVGNHLKSHNLKIVDMTLNSEILILSGENNSLDDILTQLTNTIKE